MRKLGMMMAAMGFMSGMGATEPLATSRPKQPNSSAYSPAADCDPRYFRASGKMNSQRKRRKMYRQSLHPKWLKRK